VRGGPARFARPRFRAEQRVLILDSWLRRELPVGDFAPDTMAWLVAGVIPEVPVPAVGAVAAGPGSVAVGG